MIAWEVKSLIRYYSFLFLESQYKTNDALRNNAIKTARKAVDELLESGKAKANKFPESEINGHKNFKLK
ncbi:MAG: hypothetical protein WCT44_02390 [Candidatus Paceibacterota bacterium]